MSGLVVKAVCFDMDDTLYPESEFVLGGLAAAGAVLDARFGRKDSFETFCKVHDEHGPWRIFDLGLAEMGILVEPDLIAALVQAFRFHLPNVRPFPDIPELLQSLKNRHVKLGLITDGDPKIQRAKWSALELDHFFDVAVFTGDINGQSFPKPAFEPFKVACANLGVDHSQIAMVGDNPAKDFLVPESLGWHTIRTAFAQGYHRDAFDGRKKQTTVNSVQKLKDVLMALTTPQDNPAKH